MKASYKASACALFTLSSVLAFGQTSSWRQALASDPRFSYGAKEKMPDKDTVVLEPFVVMGRSFNEERLARKIDSALKARPEKLRVSGDKISIVPDLDKPIPGSRFEDRTIFAGEKIYRNANDIFELDLPGGNVLKAQFKSGVSFKLDDGWRLILKPSRSKLIRFTKDF